VTTATVNGTTTDLTPDTTVEMLVTVWCESPRGVAVAVNREVVPRSAWPSTAVRAGDEVEIVTASAGG
jgi:sulfur carrier protein